MSNKTLLNALGIPVTPPTMPAVTGTGTQLVVQATSNITSNVVTTVPPAINPQSDEEIDFRQARTTLKMLVEQGSLVLDKVKETADDTNGARFYEIYEKMLSTLTTTSEKLIDIHQKKKDRDRPTRVPEKNVQIDKAVFVGSTTELLDQLGERDR